MIQSYSQADLKGRTEFAGFFEFEVYEPDGVTLVRKGRTHNANTLAGLDDVLSVYLGAGSQKTLWYFVLVNNVGFSAFSTSDTMASHGGWTEFTNFTQATRQAWTPGAVSGQSITNPTSASHTMDTGGGAIYGAGLVSNSTKGGTTGTLWATGAFPSVQTLSVGQILRTSYSATAAGA